MAVTCQNLALHIHFSFSAKNLTQVNKPNSKHVYVFEIHVYWNHNHPYP